MSEVLARLHQAQGAFFKAALWQTYQHLDLPKQLADSKTAAALAKTLGLNSDALTRFLNAAAFLQICIRQDNHYRHNPEAPHYSDEASQILLWLVKHKVADHLSKAATELNKLFGHDCEGKLATAERHGLLQKLENGHYTIHADLETHLLSHREGFFGHRLNHYETVMLPMWSVKGLTGALKTGHNQWQAIFGKPAAQPYDLYETLPELMKLFTRGLHHLNQLEDPILLKDFKFDKHQILDLGGGSGAMAIELLKRGTADTHVDIYELAAGLPLLQPIFAEYAPNETRVNYIAGDFFDASENGYFVNLQRKQYDVIILAWILHGETDASCVKILQRARRHLKPTGKLLIAEVIMPEDKIGPAWGLDLAMLLQTQGRERSFTEYQQLVKQAGFKGLEQRVRTTRRELLVAE